MQPAAEILLNVPLPMPEDMALEVNQCSYFTDPSGLHGPFWTLARSVSISSR